MMHHDPVCGRRMNPNKAYAKVAYKEEIFYLYCPLCQKAFEKNAEAYISIWHKHENKKRLNKNP